MGAHTDRRPPRPRGRTAVALVVTVAVGLATRAFPGAFGQLVATHGGDVLWATAAYFAAALAWPRASTATLAALALGVAFAVELSQLAHPAWLEEVRRWPGMRLVLGYGFLWGDLVRYAVGVALAVLVDHAARPRG